MPQPLGRKPDRFLVQSLNLRGQRASMMKDVRYPYTGGGALLLMFESRNGWIFHLRKDLAA